MTTEETSDKYERARRNALAAMASIREMVARLQHADECSGDPDDCELTEVEMGEWAFDEYHDPDGARQVIEEDALGIAVRSGWHSPGDQFDDEEFEILLTTGGPALRIRGDLDSGGEAENPRLEMQDWFVPWQEVPLDSADEAILLAYCRCFYFSA